MKLKIVNDRKDSHTVTIHILKGSEAIDCLYRLAGFYFLESRYIIDVITPYGFIGRKENEKVITYVIGGKSTWQSLG